MITHEEFEILLVYSVRYNLGRKTYAVSEICDIIMTELPQISENTIEVLLRDILGHSHHDVNRFGYELQNKGDIYGMDCDLKMWQRVVSALVRMLYYS